VCHAPPEMPLATSYGVVFHESPSTFLPSGSVIVIFFDSFSALAVNDGDGGNMRACKQHPLG
jgi:hypothetical protein